MERRETLRTRCGSSAPSCRPSSPARPSPSTAACENPSTSHAGLVTSEDGCCRACTGRWRFRRTRRRGSLSSGVTGSLPSGECDPRCDEAPALMIEVDATVRTLPSCSLQLQLRIRVRCICHKCAVRTHCRCRPSRHRRGCHRPSPSRHQTDPNPTTIPSPDRHRSSWPSRRSCSSGRGLRPFQDHPRPS